MSTLTPPAFCESLQALAEEVGRGDPVVPVGGKTQWAVGGLPESSAREITPPSGILEYEPAEMTVRCLANTTLADLSTELAAAGQMVPMDLPQPARATLGGVLAVGRSGLRRLGYGPIRDYLLQVVFVNASGDLIRSGGPTVKNVSGFDLCRLMVGSLGTLGIIGEVILRCVPRPAVSAWFTGEADPFALLACLFRPASLLWDGARVWLCLEGHPDDVSSQASLAGLEPCAGPPELPTAGRASLRPGELRDLNNRFTPGEFVAEVGVGVLHLPQPPPARRLDDRNLKLQKRIKQEFDPEGRLNPGRSPWQ